MNFHVPICELRHQDGLIWTTLGLGPLTKTRTGRSGAKLRKSLIKDLRKEIEELDPGELRWLVKLHAPRVLQVPLELTLHDRSGKRKKSGRFPLICGQRWTSAGHAVLLVYHPLRQNQWFSWNEENPLDEDASAFFSSVWTDVADEQIDALKAEGKERLKSIAFSAAPRSILDLLPDKKTPWDELVAQPWRDRKPKRKRFGVLTSLGVDETERAAERSLPKGMPRKPHRGQIRMLLCQEQPSSIMLVGPPGVGKTTLIYHGIYDRLEADGYEVHQNLDRVRRFWSVSAKRIIAGMSYLGEWEERCMKLLEDAKEHQVILLVEDLHTFGRVGRSRGSERNLAELFTGPVSRGEITVVGECTPGQLRFLEDDAPSFAATFTRVHVSEPTPGETLRMLFQEARELELRHEVRFQTQCFRSILEFAGSLFPSNAYPGKALTILRELTTSRTLAGRTNGKTEAEIDSDDVITVVSEKTGLPTDILKQDRELTQQHLTKELTRFVMGQGEAVETISDLILRIRAKLTDPARPYGVYLFTGPTGTGKTELAKSVAGYLYGDAARLVRLDMGEYSGPDAVSRLVGDRFRPEGILSNRAREQPFCVLLLDEIEKAHPSVFHILLQLFDEGRLTDGSGHLLDFTHAVIIMTSNLGARSQTTAGFGNDVSSQHSLRAVKEFFAPELLNRIDRVVSFKPLSDDTARKIAEKELALLLSRWGLTERGIFVECGKTPFEKIVREGFDPTLGARTVKRYLEDQVGSLLADVISSSPPADLRFLRLYVRGEDFHVHQEALTEAEAADARYAIEPLLTMNARELQSRLPETMDFLDELIMSDELQQVSDEISERLRTHCFHEPEQADAIYQLEQLRTDLRSLRGRIGYQLAQVAPEKKQILQQLAEVEFFRRAFRLVRDDSQHAIFLRLNRIGVGGQPRHVGDRKEDLLAVLAAAYSRGRVWCDGFAAGFADGKIEAKEPTTLEELTQVLENAPDVVVLKLLGLCAREELGPETGCHLWQSFGATQVVRVQVSNAPPDRSAQEELVERLQQSRWFLEALESQTGELPVNPQGLLPAIRHIRFDPPTRAGEKNLLEVEDYQLGFADSMRTDKLAEILPYLWTLRMSREET